MMKNRRTNEGEAMELKRMLADLIDAGEYYYAQMVQDKLNHLATFKYETTTTVRRENENEVCALRCQKF